MVTVWPTDRQRQFEQAHDCVALSVANSCSLCQIRRLASVSRSYQGILMATRNNIFMVHSWNNSDNHEQATSLLFAKESGLSDYSIPSWKSIGRSEERVKESIRETISWASAVIVLNTTGLHKRTFSMFEMHAAELSKRIIVLQLHGNFQQQIAAALNGFVHSVVPWRIDVLGRAIRCEYPYEDRAFHIAEKADPTSRSKLAYEEFSAEYLVSSALLRALFGRGLAAFATRDRALLTYPWLLHAGPSRIDLT